MDFFNYLEERVDAVLSRHEIVLETIILRSAQIKAGVVEKDEFDLGLRNILNYGHTIGHAIESVSGMTIWHGEAVAMGMVVEAKIARALSLITDIDVSRITGLLIKAELPTEIPSLDQEKVLEAIHHDKKITRGKIVFALPKGIGEAVMTDSVSDKVIKHALGNGK